MEAWSHRLCPPLRSTDLTAKAEQGAWRPQIMQASVPLLRSTDLTVKAEQGAWRLQITQASVAP